MKILEEPITIDELKRIAINTFGDMVKAVVDVRQGLIALGAELHSDLEALLIENGSQKKDLWGINFYLDLEGDDFVEFNSMINMRPSKGNMSQRVEDAAIRNEIIAIVNRLVKR